MSYKIYPLLFLILFISCSSSKQMIQAVDAKDNLTLKSLLYKGGNPNHYDGCFTILIIASDSGENELVRTLLERGADANLKSKRCKTEIAQANERHAIIEGMRTPLMYAANADTASLLIQYGADINARSLQGVTALELALLNQRWDVARVLLDKRVDFDVYNRCGRNIYARIVHTLFQNKNIQKDRIAVQTLSRVSLALRGSRIQEALNFSQSELDKQENINGEYKQIASGSLSKISSRTVEQIKKEPERFGETLSSKKEKRVYHLSEFVWTSTNENVWRWYVKQILKKDQEEKGKLCGIDQKP